MKGIPARSAPTDYQAHAQVGQYTIAADFAGHEVTTPDAVYESEDYIVVEVAFFGADGAHLAVSSKNFSLKLKDRKNPMLTQPFEYLTRSLTDPQWEPPEGEKEKKSKGGLSTGGQGDSGPATTPKMPLPLKRAMEQKVLHSLLPEGDRSLPVDGLIFFQYHGKPQSLRDKGMELVYEGPAGTLSLPLQP